MALVAGCSTTSDSRTDITKSARLALDDLYQKVPAARDLYSHSAGALVFPSITQAGLIVGGQYGQGVLFEGGKSKGYYNITGGSLGLQIGAQSFSQAYFFTTPDALKTFHETKGFEAAPAWTSPWPMLARLGRSRARRCRSRSLCSFGVSKA